MLLNNLSQNFVVWLPANFFYNDVEKLWKPVFKRMHLPYVTLEDMFNAQITQVSFPSINVQNVNQGLQNYKLTKRGGQTLDQQMNKTITLTIRLSDSYMTYFIARQQMELFFKWGDKFQRELYLPPINITILDDGGFENITYTYYQITPSNLSDFDLSYSAKPGTFNTFTWTFDYNYFDIWYRDENNERRKAEFDKSQGILTDPGAPNPKTEEKRRMSISKDTNNAMFDSINGIHTKSMLH